MRPSLPPIMGDRAVAARADDRGEGEAGGAGRCELAFDDPLELIFAHAGPHRRHARPEAALGRGDGAADQRQLARLLDPAHAPDQAAAVDDAGAGQARRHLLVEGEDRRDRRFGRDERAQIMEPRRPARHVDQPPSDASGPIDALEAGALAHRLPDHQPLAFPPLGVGIARGQEQQLLIGPLAGREQQRGAGLVVDAGQIGEVAVLPPAAAHPVGGKGGGREDHRHAPAHHLHQPPPPRAEDFGRKRRGAGRAPRPRRARPQRLAESGRARESRERAGGASDEPTPVEHLRPLIAEGRA